MWVLLISSILQNRKSDLQFIKLHWLVMLMSPKSLMLFFFENPNPNSASQPHSTQYYIWSVQNKRAFYKQVAIVEQVDGNEEVIGENLLEENVNILT
jgi:hypothetical protein